MSEKEMFAEMFGGAADRPQNGLGVEIHADPQNEEREETSEEAPAETPKDEAKEEKPSVAETAEDAGKEDQDEDDGVDQKLIDDAKKELGMGGAAFCDELLAGTPDAFSRLKTAGKTLHGFFNFAYSYAMDEYVKAKGRVNGGGYWNLAELLAKYLDPSVKEGFVVKEPKAKKPVPPAPSPSPAKTVEKVAKKAAKAAKGKPRKATEMKIVEPPKAEPPRDDAPKAPVDLNKLFDSIDLSNI